MLSLISCGVVIEILKNAPLLSWSITSPSRSQWFSWLVWSSIFLFQKEFNRPCRVSRVSGISSSLANVLTKISRYVGEHLKARLF